MTDGAERLAFSGLLALVGGGAFEPELLHDLAARGAALVGVDSGGDAIRAAGLMPQAIMGDFDSLRSPAEWPATVRLMHIAEQATADFEKALYSTRAPLTVALGMTGNRFDHALAAVDAVARQARTRDILLVDEADIALALAGPLDFTVAPGARVSIYPVLPIDFSGSRGLKYPLDGLHFEPGVRIGTSNEAPAGNFSVMPASRDIPWLLILERIYFWPLVEARLGEARLDGARLD